MGLFLFDNFFYLTIFVNSRQFNLEYCIQEEMGNSFIEKVQVKGLCKWHIRMVLLKSRPRSKLGHMNAYSPVMLCAHSYGSQTHDVTGLAEESWGPTCKAI